MDTKDRILDMALQLFNVQGLHRTGVRELAKAMGISPGNLSYHFPRKQDILQGLLDRYRLQHDSRIDNLPDAELTLTRYLDFLGSGFLHRYAYRGIFLGTHELQEVLDQEFDLSKVNRERMVALDRQLMALDASGELDLSEEEDRHFLREQLAFTIRFWLMEGVRNFPQDPPETLVRRYLARLARLFSFFATVNGQHSLGPWLAGER